MLRVWHAKTFLGEAIHIVQVDERVAPAGEPVMQSLRMRYLLSTLDSMAVIVKDPDVLGGEPVFRQTRVPFQALLDYLEHGKTLDQFLDQFPSVTREDAIAALEEAKSLVVARLG